MTSNSEHALLKKINKAVAAANEAEATVTTAQAELVSRSKALGLLLLEAKKLHPAVKDFEMFLKRVDGLQRTRAYDCMRVAGGRITDEELRQQERDRKRKTRAKNKLPKPVSGTNPLVPESLEVSIEERKAQHAALDQSAEEDAEKPQDEFAGWLDVEEKARKESADCLGYFKASCKSYLPRLNGDDLKKARTFVTLDQWRAKKEAA
jgi:hypothetical protein